MRRGGLGERTESERDRRRRRRMLMGEERGSRGRWGGGAYVERLGGPEEAGWG